MGRQLRRMPINFDWPLDDGPWWGLVLPAITCQRCLGNNSSACGDCEGEGKVYPRVAIPGWEGTVKPGEEDKRDAEDKSYRMGWQLWETVSEGSPCSPVCETPRELAEWLSQNDTSITSGTDIEGWLAFMHAGDAPSMVMTGRHLQSGVEFVAEHDAAPDA